MVYRGKKGQAKIIVIVLMILLILVLIGVLWGILSAVINEQSGEIGLPSSVILKGSIESFNVNIDNSIAKVVVKRGSEEDSDISGIKLIFEGCGGIYFYENKTDYPKSLENKLYFVSNDSLGIETFSCIEKVSVSYIYEKNGEDYVTPPLDGEDVGPECVPKDCLDLEASCEVFNDGCGSKLYCGKCDLFKIWAFSDTHLDSLDYGYELFSDRLDDMKDKYDMGIFAGDLVFKSSQLEYIENLSKILIEKGVDDSISVITGNHDVLYSLTGEDSSAVPNYYLEHMSEQNSYNFTKQVGNILFIYMGDEFGYATNTQSISYSTYEWFNKTVAENQDKLIFVVTHRHTTVIPGHSWDLEFGYRDEILEIFNNYHVDAWFYGHTHGYNVLEESFGSRNTLFVNTGNLECGNRRCATNEHISSLVLLKDRSRQINFQKLNYSTEDNYIGAIHNYDSTSYLRMPFCLEGSCGEEVLCSIDPDCEDYEFTRVCDESRGYCGVCADNSDCENYEFRKVCDKSRGYCLGCVDNSDCDSTEWCDDSTNTCEEGCEFDDQCSGLTPFCDVENHECVGCLGDGDCEDLDVCWEFNNSCISIPCSKNSECEDYDDCTHDKCIEGFCEFVDASEEDCYYCVNLQLCNVGPFNICGGRDVNHNGIVEQEDANFVLTYWRIPCNETNSFCLYSDVDRNGAISFSDSTESSDNIGTECILEPWRACDLGVGVAEICGDGFDNDCDGAVDEVECD